MASVLHFTKSGSHFNIKSRQYYVFRWWYAMVLCVGLYTHSNAQSFEFVNATCSCCTAILCETETYAPTEMPTDPTQHPTKSPSSAEKTTTLYPTPGPSPSPTPAPSNVPTTTPPTAQPTTAPPTSAPTNTTVPPTSFPTDGPSESPTTPDPTISPTPGPTLDPTKEPTTDPSVSPTEDPTNSPTATPITLQQALEIKVDDQYPFDDTAQWMTIIVGGVGVIALMTSIVYGRGTCKERRYTVDDQQMGGVLIYFMQLVDLYSDIILSIQFRLYYLWSKDRDWIPQRTVDILNWLFILSMAFVAVPYFGNIGSAMNVVQRISTDKVISRFSKEYFANHTKLFTVLVLLSGGSIRALKFMSSNLLGSSKFSSGLSPLQIQQFRAHHLIGTVLMENIPQLIMQGFFMFDLNMYTTTVLISFISSVVNVVLSIKTEVDQCLANQNLSESPFTILLKWDRAKTGSAASVDPYDQTGRRSALSRNLSAVTYGTGGPITAQITSCTRHAGSTSICGVLEFDANTDTINNVFEEFEKKQDEVRAAVLESFGFDSIFMGQTGFEFDIEISQSSGSSQVERVDVVKELMSEVGFDQDAITRWENSIITASHATRKLARTKGTRNILGLIDINDGHHSVSDSVGDGIHLNAGFHTQRNTGHHTALPSLSSMALSYVDPNAEGIEVEMTKGNYHGFVMEADNDVDLDKVQNMSQDLDATQNVKE